MPIGYNNDISVAIVAIMFFYVASSVTFFTMLSGNERLDFRSHFIQNTINTCFIGVFIIGLVDKFGPQSCNFWLYANGFSIILILSLVCFGYITKEFVKLKRLVHFEYDTLIALSLVGLALINSCCDLLTFYLAVELQSLGFYVLATFHKRSEQAAESGIKYFILGAFSSCLLLFAIALIYSSYGLVFFESIDRISHTFHCWLAIYGCTCFIVTVLFKLGLFPFHMWLCDVYDGATINITAFFSTVPKIVMLGFLIRMLFTVFTSNVSLINFLLGFSGVGSISFASVAALYQKRIKRLVAYSTISHTGFLALSLCCLSADAVKACIVYIILYIIMSLALFAILMLGALVKQQKYIINWNGLFSCNLGIAVGLGILFLSMAGIPPLSGFYSKLCVLFVLLSNNLLSLAFIVVVFSSVACFYYIKLLKLFFFSNPTSAIFWFGQNTKSVEFFISVALIIVSFFLARSALVIDYSALSAFWLC